MLQILELNPTNLPIFDLLDQLQGLKDGLAFPTDLGEVPIPADLPLPDLSALAAVVAQFEDMAQKLGAGPGALADDVLKPLGGLSSGLLEISTPLVSLASAAAPAGTAGVEFQTFFNQFSADVLPIVNTLQDQQVDGAYLSQLFQLESLAASLPTRLDRVVRRPLQEIDAITTLLAPLADDQWLAVYKAALETVATTAVEKLTLLDDATVQQIQGGVETLSRQTQKAAEGLSSFDASLNTLAQDLTGALEGALDQIDPQKLGGTLSVFDAAVTTLEGLQVAGATAKIEQIAAAVDTLVAQNLDKLTGTIDQTVVAIQQGIGLAKQALVKVSAIVSDLLGQLKGFVEKADLPGLVGQVKGAFNTFAVALNKVLEQVNQGINKVYDFVMGIVKKIAGLDFKPIVQALHDVLAEITAILAHPQVRQTLQQAKAGIDQVAQRLDSVTLKPVFDRVVAEADDVKAKLAAIDVSQLNAMLREALKLALGLVKSAIDPPSKVTGVINEQYDTAIKPVTTGLIEPIRDQLKQIADVIDSFRPGTLVAELLTPPFEAAAAELKQLIAPEQILAHLDGLTKFYESLLATIDEKANPAKLLSPLVQYYRVLIDFVQGLSPERLVDPLNTLLETVKQQVNGLEIEKIVEQIKAPIDQIVQSVSGFRLEEQPFWEPVQKFLNIRPEDLIDGFVQRIKTTIGQLDVSSLGSVPAALRSAATTVRQEIREPEVLSRMQALVAQTSKNIQAYLGSLTALTDLWQKANSRPLPDALKQQLQALNPIKRLAGLTNLLDRIGQMLNTIQTTLSQTWQTLAGRLDQGGARLDVLLSDRPDALKAYLRQALDAFAAGPLKRVIALLDQPLAALKRAVDAFLGLQKHLDTLKTIPEAMERIGGSIGEVKTAVMDFNLSFLTDALQDLMGTVVTPLEALDPAAFLQELDAIFRRTMETLRSLNPADIIASARGSVLLARGAGADAIFIPFGTRLSAETPVGQKHFKTIQAVTLEEGQPSVIVQVQALSPGPGGDIVVGKEGAAGGAKATVTWQVDMPVPALASLVVSHDEPILSLSTFVNNVVEEKLNALHPDKIIAEPLNKEYEKIVQLKDDLGFERLLDALFDKFASIEQELKEGLERSAGAFGGVLAAIPV